MADKHFDLIVIGTGPAGTLIATQLAEHGKRVAIVEERELGGTCALRGCNPKKVYTEAATLVEQIRNAKYLSTDQHDIELDWASLHAFQREFTQSVPERWREKFRSAGVHVLEGTARFISAKEISVDGGSYTADKFAIAAGAKPAPLDSPGSELVINSDEFLEQSDLPNRVVFLGGGYISMEFATAVAASGREVLIIDRHPRVLKQFDPDLVDLLTEHMKKRGVSFRPEREIKSIERTAEGHLSIETDRGEKIDCDMVVHGAGRVPNTGEINLAAAKIDADDSGIAVDAYLRSRSNANVYVAGDCVAGETAKLTPTAEYHADIVIKNLKRDSPVARRSELIVPAVAFTVPSLAAVGMSEKDAREQGKSVRVNFDNTSTRGNVRKALNAVAGYKIIIDSSTDRILGAHLLGPTAQENINLFAMAIQHNIVAKDFKAMHWGYPTFAADISGML